MDKFTLVAVAKNEGRFLKEWVLYHRLVCGFDQILVYNNDSEDESEEVLSDLSSKGMCLWMDWPRSSHNPPQSTAYHHAFQALKGTRGWLCFMDIDEFLFLKDGSNIRSFMGRFGEEVGSVSFNWAMFYSVDERTSDDPVTKSVNCFLEESGHVKTIARIGAIRVPCIHSFRLAPGFRYMHCSGFDYGIDLKELSSIKMSLDASLCVRRPHIDCTVAQINHYHVKSKEYCLAKDQKGCVASANFRNLMSIEKYNRLKKIENNTTKDDIYKDLFSRGFYEILDGHSSS